MCSTVSIHQGPNQLGANKIQFYVTPGSDPRPNAFYAIILDAAAVGSGVPADPDDVTANPRPKKYRYGEATIVGYDPTHGPLYEVADVPDASAGADYKLAVVWAAWYRHDQYGYS